MKKEITLGSGALVLIANLMVLSAQANASNSAPAAENIENSTAEIQKLINRGVLTIDPATNQLVVDQEVAKSLHDKTTVFDQHEVSTTNQDMFVKSGDNW